VQGRRRTEGGHSPRSASPLSGEYCGTTASRPNNVPGPSSPGPGTSRWEPHDDRAVRAVSLRGCQTPFHRSVVSAEARSEMAHRSKINSPISQRSSRNPALPHGCINNLLQFRNDSGFLSNSSGQGGGLYVIHNPGHPKSQRLRARTTDQCEIRCERQGRRSGASAEPSGPSTRVPTGTRAIRHLHCTESDLAQHHWSSTVQDHLSDHRQCANLTCSQCLFL
jgi:hypothetical protein